MGEPAAAAKSRSIDFDVTRRGSSLAVSMAAAAKAVDLTGTWVLQKTEGIDDFLISMEQPWLKRKAAKVIRGRSRWTRRSSRPHGWPRICESLVLTSSTVGTWAILRAHLFVLRRGAARRGSGSP